MPWILTISPRSLAAGGVEVTCRATGERTIEPLEAVEARSPGIGREAGGPGAMGALPPKRRLSRAPRGPRFSSWLCSSSVTVPAAEDRCRGGVRRRSRRRLRVSGERAAAEPRPRSPPRRARRRRRRARRAGPDRHCRQRARPSPGGATPGTHGRPERPRGVHRPPRRGDRPHRARDRAPRAASSPRGPSTARRSTSAPCGRPRGRLAGPGGRLGAAPPAADPDRVHRQPEP